MVLLRTGGRNMSKVTVLSVDPGKASGIAVISWETGLEPVILTSMEVQPDVYADEIEKAFESFSSQYGTFLVACESFTINAQTAKKSQAPWSLENIGVLKHICRRSGYDPLNIAFQAPVNAKNMFPNPALKTLELWHKGGEGHANDAIRHGLLRLVKAGWHPVKLLTADN
jgi:hypothetical protein